MSRACACACVSLLHVCLLCLLPSCAAAGSTQASLDVYFTKHGEVFASASTRRNPSKALIIHKPPNFHAITAKAGDALPSGWTWECFTPIEAWEPVPSQSRVVGSLLRRHCRCPHASCIISPQKNNEIFTTLGMFPLYYQSLMGLIVPPSRIPTKDCWPKGEHPNHNPPTLSIGDGGIHVQDRVRKPRGRHRAGSHGFRV